MPAKKVISDGKKRVRTGCAACRARRRKCDAKKPSCANCEARGVECKYPALKFVLNEGKTGNGTPQQYQRVQFVEPAISEPPNTGQTDFSVERSSHRSTRRASSSGEAPSERPLVSWDGYFKVHGVSPARKYAGFLRHFRYYMVPWIDAGDPHSNFGEEVMKLADCDTQIRSAIVGLAGTQKDLLAGRTPSHTATAAGSVCEALSTIERALRSRPSRWGECVSILEPAYAEPLQTLRQMCARIDLAFSIIQQQPPKTPLSFFSLPTDPASAAYLTALQHLTATLLHVYGDGDLPWRALWDELQAWHDCRPLTMRPILEVGSIEAGRLDPKTAASFPITVYTNTLAMQANVAYHLTSTLLLAHKPRLVKIRSRQTHASSQAWHAQSIAGIATTNRFAEQWDPVMIAALVHVAREMTHRSQQTALEECLGAAETSTGLLLDEELAALRSRWASDAYL